MSYILDALRKSEQERQRGKVPDLNSFKDDSAQTSARINIWPWIAVAAVVANLVVVLVIWAPWNRNAAPTLAAPTPVAVTPPAVTPVPQQTAQVVAPKPAPNPAQLPVQHSIQNTAQQPVVQASPQPVTQATPQPVHTRRPQPSEFEESAVITPMPVQAAPTTVSPDPGFAEPAPFQEPVANTRAPAVAYMPQLEELPADERQGIPDMTFSSHMYSSMPRFRSIIINGKRLKEGEYFTENLQVREITEKGVIMSSGSTLFAVDVLGRWAQ